MDIPTLLSTKVDAECTMKQYEDWLEGGDEYDTFDDAVKEFLGVEDYNKWDTHARVNVAPICKLKGLELSWKNINAIEEELMLKADMESIDEDMLRWAM